MHPNWSGTWIFFTLANLANFHVAAILAISAYIEPNKWFQNSDIIIIPSPPPKTVGRVIYHTILCMNLNIKIPLWYFCRRPVFVITLKIWLDQTCDPELQFWVLLVVTNKNHGQPFVQYAEISEPFLMGASYYPEEVSLNLGSLISAYWPN
jgi:hypothetical protein